ncbi:MAG: FkbM family methyltransferase [Kiritimatiellia bacterium]|jgi:FkbM family methyltransferase
MLHDLSIDQLDGGLNFIDIGASGGFPRDWEQLKARINYFAFEPNAEECERLRKEASPFHAVEWFPTAVAGSAGEAPIYMTRDPFCWSLLNPNRPFLDRFTFGEKFIVEGTTSVSTVTLAEVMELEGVDADILKVDSQGLDREILEQGSALLDRAFYVEMEPGFNDSYLKENTYAEVDAFMREQGFRLFDLNCHRVPRNNVMQAHVAGAAQIIWAESVWLRDYVWMDQQGCFPLISRGKALKVLLICEVERRYDFGLELAELFESKGLLTQAEVQALLERWPLPPPPPDPGPASFLRSLLRLLPWSLRARIAAAASESLNDQHLFKG